MMEFIRTWYTIRAVVRKIYHRIADGYQLAADGYQLAVGGYQLAAGVVKILLKLLVPTRHRALTLDDCRPYAIDLCRRVDPDRHRLLVIVNWEEWEIVDEL